MFDQEFNPGWILNQARNQARHGVEFLLEFKRHGRDGRNSGPRKVPKSTDFIDELPKNSVGKTLKTALRKPHWVAGTGP